jgi:hypothetical protein
MEEIVCRAYVEDGWVYFATEVRRSEVGRQVQRQGSRGTRRRRGGQ